jgi:hypothetical protein
LGTTFEGEEEVRRRGRFGRMWKREVENLLSCGLIAIELKL